MRFDCSKYTLKTVFLAVVPHVCWSSRFLKGSINIISTSARNKSSNYLSLYFCRGRGRCVIIVFVILNVYIYILIYLAAVV